MILVTVCFISTADIAPRISALPTSFSRKGWRFRLGVQFGLLQYVFSVCYSAPMLLGTWILLCTVRVVLENLYSIQYVKLISRYMQHVSTIPN